jgi:hypothetical protein
VEDIPGSSMFRSMAPAPDSNRAEALKALSAEEANFIMYGYPASVLGGGSQHAHVGFWPGGSSAQRKQQCAMESASEKWYVERRWREWRCRGAGVGWRQGEPRDRVAT